MGTGDDAHILNCDRLQESTGGDPAFMRELAQIYLSDTVEKVPLMLAAGENGELQEMGNVAHGLKGASHTMGCEEAAAAFLRVEEIGRGDDGAGVEDALALAREAWERACAELRKLAA